MSINSSTNCRAMEVTSSQLFQVIDQSSMVTDRINFFLMRGFIYVVVIVLFFLFILEDIRNISGKFYNSSISFIHLSLLSFSEEFQNILFRLFSQNIYHKATDGINFNVEVQDIIRYQLMKINKVADRVMFLSPTVQAGWEAESFKMDFQNMSTLGQGSYGVVWKAKHKKSGAIYAIKEIKKKSLKTQNLLNHVRTQVKIMYELNHPNITKLYNHFEDDFSVYFVLEYAQNGQLFNALLKNPNKHFDEPKAAHYIKQLVKALQVIHKKNIIHRDIKPENLLIGKNDELKLADFGWSNFTEGKNKRETYCGTLDYLAPEMVAKEHLHDYRVDIWSVGVLIYQLCTGASPFSSPLYSKATISEADVKKNISTLNYALPKDLSESCRDLISKILILQPEDRISIEGILNHPWIKQSTIEEPELVQDENWQTKLKNQFGVILDTKDEEIKKYEVFSKEEIYSYSRIESIINANKKKIQEQSDKKVRQHKLRIEELQKRTKRQEDEIKFLRQVQVQHQKCDLQLTRAKDENRRLNKRIETMEFQMQDYARIIKQFQKNAKR